MEKVLYFDYIPLVMIIQMLIILIILFSLSKTQLYVLLVTLSARDNQKLSKLLSKGSERSLYWNEY